MDFGRLSGHSPWTAARTGLIAAAGAFAICAVFLLIAGRNPLQAALVMLTGAFGQRSFGPKGF